MTIDPSAAARQRDLAWAEALAGLARVAVTLSGRLRELHEASPSPAGRRGGAVRAAKGRARPTTPPAGGATLPRGGFGPRQLAVLGLRGLDTELGLAASEVAAAVGMTAPNSTTLLNGLVKLEALERVPDERPIRWRRYPT